MRSDSFSNILGIEVEEVKDGYARVVGKVRKEFTNFHGTAHGAFIFSIADSALALAANYDTKRVAVTIKIDYLKPAFVDDILVGEAERVHGKRVVFYDLKVRRGEELIAKGSAITFKTQTQ